MNITLSQIFASEYNASDRDRDENKKSVPVASKFPEPADLLNQLKTRRKKSGANWANTEVILAILGTERSEI